MEIKDRNGIKIKIGDKFRLPNNSSYKGIYTVSEIDDHKIYGKGVWSFFPECCTKLWSSPYQIELVSNNSLKMKLNSIINKLKGKK